MRVKKFEAKSMKEALRMIKSELGPEAVILGARENRRGFGLGGDTSFEVTAAVSEPTLQKKNFVESRLRPEDREKFRQANARAQKTMIEKMVEKRVRTLPEAFRYQSKNRMTKPHGTMTASLGAAGNSTDRDIDTSIARPTQPRPRTQINYIDILDDEGSELGAGTAAEAPSKNLPKQAASSNQMGSPSPALLPSKLSRASQNSAPASELDQLREEVRRLQNLLIEKSNGADPSGSNMQQPQSTPIAKGSTEPIASRAQAAGSGYPGAKYGLSYDFSATYSRLVQSGMSEGLVAEILRRAMQEIDPIQSKKKSLIDAWVAKWLLMHIGVLERPFAQRMHVFVGPVGSGKTAHLVKVAAQLVIRDKKRVAIVTTDTAKVGAVDQLKIYSQILNVPFAVVRDRADWEIIDRELAHVDFILVDTTGSSLGQLEEIQELKKTLPKGAKAVHLCLQATMKESDAIETVRRFRAVQPSDLVFSAVDLSVQHGVIATVQLSSGLNLHSFGTGPRIPEDFEIATRERVLDLVFKLSTIRSPNELANGVSDSVSGRSQNGDSQVEA